MFSLRRTVTIGVLLLWGAVALAQTPSQTPSPTPHKTLAAPRVSTKPGEPRAPQVVTIVHRLNGLKMFRLLLRSDQQVQAINGLDSTFKLTDEVHTNVIAGLAMDDGETIAAWLPEANLEFAAPRFPKSFDNTNAEFKFSFTDPPDVSVIGPDGKEVLAKYVGFDATTGLSILRVAEKSSAHD